MRNQSAPLYTRVPCPLSHPRPKPAVPGSLVEGQRGRELLLRVLVSLEVLRVVNVLLDMFVNKNSVQLVLRQFWGMIRTSYAALLPIPEENPLFHALFP